MSVVWKIQPAQINIKDVINNSHLNSDIKEKFRKILPNLDRDQIKEIYNFIQNEENKILDLEKKVQEEESEYYQKMLKNLDETLEKEKKEIRKIAEWNELEKEEETEEDLLKELENL